MSRLDTTRHPMPDDAALERMLRRRAGTVIPAGLERAIADAVRQTPQRRSLRRWLSGAMTPVAPGQRLVLVAATAALLLALLAGALFVGARLLQPPRLPIDETRLRGTGIEFLTESAAYTRVVADGRGAVWALSPGRLSRYEPSTGTSRAWTSGDDARFTARGMAGSRGDGVWLIDGPVIRRFDGDRFLSSATIPAEIAAAAEAPDGTAWLATYDGRLFHPTGGAVASFAPPASSVSSVVLTMAVDAAGHVWFGRSDDPTEPGGGSVVRFDGAAWTTFGGADAAAMAGSVREIVAAGDGNVLAATETGVARFDGLTWTDLTANEADGAPFTAAAFAPDGSTWVGGAGQVHHLVATTWTAYDASSGLPDGAGGGDDDLVATADGVFLGGAQGLYRLEGELWQRVLPLATAIDPGPPTTIFRAPVVATSATEAWIAVGTRVWHGIGTGLTALPEAGHEITDLVIAPGGVPWIATDAGVFQFVDDAWRPVQIAGFPAGADALALAADGTVLASGAGVPASPTPEGDTRSVVQVATDGSIRRELPLTGLIGGSGRVVAAPDGTIWAAGWAPFGIKGGLVRFRDGAWEAVRPDEVTGDFLVRGLALAPDGAVWVTGGDLVATADGTAAGGEWVARFDGVAWRVFRRLGEIDLQPSDRGGQVQAFALAIAPDGSVSVATSAGIGRFDGMTWTTSAPGLAVFDLAIAPDGALWASGQFGLLRVPGGAARP